MNCPICNGELKISRVRKKVGRKMVKTASHIQYCTMYGCDYEKILTGTLPTQPNEGRE